MTIICYPRCSTCKKAETFLTESGLAYTYRDIKTDNPTADELDRFIEQSGLEPRRFFNTSGQLYRQLNLKDRLPTMDRSEMIALLATDGMLVKRPLLVTDTTVLVGFSQEKWEQHLL